MACSHTEWLCLANRGTSSVVRQTGRLRSLICSLPDPSNQYPTLQLLVEAQDRRILTAAEPCTSANPGSVHLCLDSDTLSENNPAIIASAFPIHPRRQTVLRKGFKCCSTIGQHTIHGSPANSQALLYSQLLFPFVDVFCFTYHDVSDLDNIVEHLVTWTEIRKQLSSRCTLPEISIILTKEGARKADALEELLKGLARSSVEHITPEFFSDIRFSMIGRDTLTSREGRLRLRSCLRKASVRMQRRRAGEGLLFSAQHFMSFTQIAFDHLSRTVPFNFIKASRLLNPLAVDLAEHIANFVRQVENAQDLTTFAAETIASSFLLDHYPPGMHGM